MAKRLLSVETLHSLLIYDAGSGTLFWKRRPREVFATDHSFKVWNTRYAGKPAFHCINGDGYRMGAALGMTGKAHRVIWAIMTGAWPTGEIDHINGVRHDNRWENLRSVTQAENLKNKRRRSDNISGFNGVTPYKKAWRARVSIGGRPILLGYYRTIEEAAAAREEANARLGFHPNHGLAV